MIRAPFYGDRDSPRRTASARRPNCADERTWQSFPDDASLCLHSAHARRRVLDVRRAVCLLAYDGMPPTVRRGESRSPVAARLPMRIDSGSDHGVTAARCWLFATSNRSRLAVQAKSDKSPAARPARRDCAKQQQRQSGCEGPIAGAASARGPCCRAAERFGRPAEPISQREWPASSSAVTRWGSPASPVRA